LSTPGLRRKDDVYLAKGTGLADGGYLVAIVISIIRSDWES
jgi:hypothetical protein